MRNNICPKCGSDMWLEETYKLDRQTGWVWVCPNEDYEEQAEDEEDPDFEYDLSRDIKLLNKED